MTTVTYKSLSDYGALLLAPSLNLFVREMLEPKYKDSKAICLAREGWVFFNLLTKLEGLNLIKLKFSPAYLQVSRSLLFRAGMFDEYILSISLRNGFKGSLRSLLVNRYCLMPHEIDAAFTEGELSAVIVLPQDVSKVELLINRRMEKILPFVEHTSESLNKYLNTIFSEKNSTPLMIDVGYSGTIQKILTHLIGQDTQGLYYITTSSGDIKIGDNSCDIHGVLEKDVSWGTGNILLERSLLLESLMTAPHGQVSDIHLKLGGEFEFVYGPKASTQTHSQDYSVFMWGAINQVCEDFKNGVNYSRQEVVSMLEKQTGDVRLIPSSIRHLLRLDDGICGNGMIDPIKIYGMV